MVGAGAPELQGFSTDISYAPGEIVELKVDSAATAYRVDVYRLGHYGGAGARKVATVPPSATLAARQPSPLVDVESGLIDCGGWQVSARWTVPVDAVSGVYVAKLVRTDGVDGSSHVVFVVRDDERGAELLFQTSDTTWQAYNTYGGRSLYRPSRRTRALKVSYDRPLDTRASEPSSSFFAAEYPMIRWLEANGYDVSYTTGVDTARRGSQLLEHDVFLSVGHDEYWSGEQRANVEAARDAGVHLAFFSGNAVFWKTDWEPSMTDPTAEHRTLVCRKESHGDVRRAPEWTGSWRDPSSGDPRPENALQGNIFTVNGPRWDPITVSSDEGKMRFWRNTALASLAADETARLPAGVLGHEWNEDLDNGHRPAGLVRLSTTSVRVRTRLRDHGSTFGAGRATHHLTLHRHDSGALVFGAGTVQWSWGLDDHHDNPPGKTSPPPDVRVQQATVNLFADMGVQPATLQPGLVRSAAWIDVALPVALLRSPRAGRVARVGRRMTITGSATNERGVVGAVEVSVDGGATWHPASGRSIWHWSWVPETEGSATIVARAANDVGFLGPPSEPVEVAIAPARFRSRAGQDVADTTSA